MGVLDDVVGQEVRTRTGRGDSEVPQESASEDVEQKNQEAIELESVREIREPEPHNAHEVRDQGV